MLRRYVITILIIVVVSILAGNHAKKDKQIQELTTQLQFEKDAYKALDKERTNEREDYERRIEALNSKVSELNEVIASQEDELKKLRSEAIKTSSTVSKNCLTKDKGIFTGPSGKETYYNLPMKGVIERMRKRGYDAEDYPYWEREDGVRMLGPYVMIACNLKYRPYETIVPTSLGDGIVCDTGRLSKDQVDIAVNWR